LIAVYKRPSHIYSTKSENIVCFGHNYTNEYCKTVEIKGWE
jgi:hypothetical protein